MNTLIFIIDRLGSDSVHDVFFLESREVFFFHNFLELCLKSLELFSEFIAAEVNYLIKFALFFGISLADSVVEH